VKVEKPATPQGIAGYEYKKEVGKHLRPRQQAKMID
jgi:hypothetical protein